MNINLRKIMTSASILLGLNTNYSIATASEVDTIENHRSIITSSAPTVGGRSAINIYADEMQSIVQKRLAIIASYAPDNLRRTTFNGLKTSDAITFNDKEYLISGLRKAETEEAKDIVRRNFRAKLPHDRAYLSNQIGLLYVKGSMVNADSYVQIQYGYKPGPLDRSGITEYSFEVEVALDMCDKAQYNQLAKQVKSFSHYMDLDAQDRAEASPIIPQLWDMTQEATTYNDKLRLQAQTTLLQRLKEYQKLRFSRLFMLANYHTLSEEDHKAMLRSFSNQVLQYREYLVDTANKLHSLSDNGKFEDALKGLLSNSSRFYTPLSKFPSWFVRKDKTAPEYDFYKS